VIVLNVRLLPLKLIYHIWILLVIGVCHNVTNVAVWHCTVPHNQLRMTPCARELPIYIYSGYWYIAYRT